jgi:hypothetical protein
VFTTDVPGMVGDVEVPGGMIEYATLVLGPPMVVPGTLTAVAVVLVVVLERPIDVCTGDEPGTDEPGVVTIDVAEMVGDVEVPCGVIETPVDGRPVLVDGDTPGVLDGSPDTIEVPGVEVPGPYPLGVWDGEVGLGVDIVTEIIMGRLRDGLLLVPPALVDEPPGLVDEPLVVVDRPPDVVDELSVVVDVPLPVDA